MATQARRGAGRTVGGGNTRGGAGRSLGRSAPGGGGGDLTNTRRGAGRTVSGRPGSSNPAVSGGGNG